MIMPYDNIQHIRLKTKLSGRVWVFIGTNFLFKWVTVLLSSFTPFLLR